ncbi:MAG: hypothetical protein AAGE37_08665 [Pseudomonadota bacterium]
MEPSSLIIYRQAIQKGKDKKIVPARLKLMNVLPIENKSNETLRIMLEPWAEEYDIEPGMSVSLSGDLTGLQIDYHTETYISFWLEHEIKVLLDNKEMTPVS